MRVSLIISTYNWPEALNLCLDRCMRQTRLPDEILVADDGSKSPTAELIAGIAQEAPLPVRHIRHEDKGFRLAAIRNKAIAASTGDLIIVIDGDVLPQRNFIEDHIWAARPGRLVRGSRLFLESPTAKRLLAGRSGRWLALDSSILTNLHRLRIAFLSRWTSTLHRTHTRALGCNTAFWRDDALEVNGYNEAIEGWGAEDEDFQNRLINAGRSLYHVRQRAIVFHLWHPLASRENNEQNYAISDRARDLGQTWCELGLDQHLKPSPQTVTRRGVA